MSYDGYASRDDGYGESYVDYDGPPKERPARMARQFSWVSDAMKQGMSGADIRDILATMGLNEQDLRDQLSFIDEDGGSANDESHRSFIENEGFDDHDDDDCIDQEQEHVLEQYRLMAQIEARAQVRDNIGYDVQDFMIEKRGKLPASSDDMSKLNKLRPPTFKPEVDRDSEDSTSELPSILLNKSLGEPGKIQKIPRSACPAELQIGRKAKEEVPENTVFLEFADDAMAMTEEPLNMKPGRRFGKRGGLTKGADIDEESSQPPSRTLRRDNKKIVRSSDSISTIARTSTDSGSNVNGSGSGSGTSIMSSVGSMDESDAIYEKIVSSLFLPDSIEVRCLGCRATLFVHPLTSLVQCPECGTVSPATASRS